MSLTTTVGSPASDPMTRVSPVGTVAVQCTRPLPPGVVADGLGDAAADALADGLVEATACAEVVGVAWLEGFDPPQAAASNKAAINDPRRTP
jgi:hypothetical protein